MATEIAVNTPAGTMPALYAVPNGSGPFPAVLVAHHRGGIDQFTRYVCERIAKAGIIAMAPNFYYRRPPDEDPIVARKYLRDKDLVADLRASVLWMLSMAEINKDSVGIVGHCLGGRIAYLGIGTDPTYKAAALFYGGGLFISRDDDPKMPAPIELTKNIRCPVIGFFGKNDSNPSESDVVRISSELACYSIKHEIISFEGAGHAFQDFTNPNHFCEEPAERAWARLEEFLTDTL
jgi:carboxymethylenebutenolidase